MKVLIFSELLYPLGSGGEFATHLYASLLVEHGVDVWVVSCCSGDVGCLRSYPYRVVCIRCLGRGKYSFNFDGRITRLVSRVDVVYFASSFWRLIPLVKRLGKPVVAHIHSYDPVCPAGSLYNFLYGGTCNPAFRRCARCVYLYERGQLRSLGLAVASTVLNSSVGAVFARLLRYVDSLVFVSKRQRQLFLEHLKHVTGNIPKSFVIYNPVPEADYSVPMSVDVGYFGGASPLKGYHVLFRAWAKVYVGYRGVRLHATKMGVLAGSETLRRIGIVAYGRLSLDRLEDVWRRVSTVVVPSVWEEPAAHYVVVEALLRGRLLIASRVGGIPEIAGGAPGVRFVEPGDVDGLVDALNWALSMDRSEAIELGLRNREYALKKFDSKRSARELIRVFEHLI